MRRPRIVVSEVIRAITFKWVSALFKSLVHWLRVSIARKKLGRDAKAVEICVPIHHPSFHRPDPLIYSQKYLLSLGLAVTWDNPDIVLFRNGVIVSEGDLLPDTDYEIEATIWNNSFDAPIVGLTVDFAFLSFGVGTTLTPIGTRIINLGVKGGINHPAHARIPWRTPLAGHYCIQVDLKWADDLNPSNNSGQNNVNVVSPQSPTSFSFQLRNNTVRKATYAFSTDMYTLPILKVCEERITTKTNDEKWKAIQNLHDRSKHIVPPDWKVTVSPANVELSPNEEAPIELTINPPAGFTGIKALNVHTLRDNIVFEGGVTVYVSKP
jgi:hypothetical protein